ncbi:MAG: hypothetical protein ABSB32_18080 [Thermodesulfobacteriota bacterium]
MLQAGHFPVDRGIADTFGKPLALIAENLVRTYVEKVFLSEVRDQVEVDGDLVPDVGAKQCRVLFVDQVFLGKLPQGDFLVLDDPVLLKGQIGKFLVENLLCILFPRANLLPLAVPAGDDVRPPIPIPLENSSPCHDQSPISPWVHLEGQGEGRE